MLDFSSQVLGFGFMQIQAMNNIRACTYKIHGLIEAELLEDDTFVCGHLDRSWEYNSSVEQLDDEEGHKLK